MKDPLDPFDCDADPREESPEAIARKLQVTEDFRWLMQLPQFRRYMRRQLERTGVYRTTFRPNSEMAFLEGVRSVGVQMLSDCHSMALEETFTMMREMLDE